MKTARHLLVLVGVVVLLAPVVRAGELSDPDTAVEAGREALDDQWDLNWYDGDKDQFKPLDLKPPKKSNWQWPQWIGDFFNWMGNWDLGFDLGSLLRVLAWVGIIAVVGWLVYLLVRAIQRVELKSADVATNREEDRSRIAQVEQLPVAVERGVTDLFSEARRRFAAGDLSMAVVYLFSHQLLVLDRNHLIRLVKGKTNRQYLSELRRATASGGPSGQATLTPTLKQTTLLFERAFFGAHPPDAKRLEKLIAATSAFEAEANAMGEAG